jgi:hypothetical protein
MNPLDSSKCVFRVCAALAAAGILFLAAGCGNSNGLPQVIVGGFTKASLKGQYVISQTGTGVNQSGTGVNAFSETIVFTSDGNGNLNLLVDDFNQGGSPFEDKNFTGTYTINSSGSGILTFNFPNNVTTNYAFTMIDDSHFYDIELDQFATASGYGELQQTASFAIPSGNFVFKAHNPNTSSRVGGMTVVGGTISAGANEDRLNIGSQSVNQSISGSFSSTPETSTLGRGTFTLSDTGTNATFYYYVVNSGKFYLLSSNGSLEIGQAETQSGGPFSVATLATNNSYVFGSAGDTITSGQAGIHSAGVFSTDGNGNITSGGAVDYVQDTTVNQDLGVTGGSYTLASSGRGQINLTLSGGTISPQIFWMVNNSRAYFLVDSTTSNAIEDGTFSQQSGAPFSAVGAQAAFVMDGFDTTLKDRAGVFQPTTNGNFKWNQSANAFDPLSGVGTPTSIGTTGTFQVSSNGRVAVVVNGVTSSLVFYLSSASSGVMVQEDADIGGAFSTQASQ